MKTFSLALALVAPVAVGAQSVSASSHTRASASVDMRRAAQDTTAYRAPSRFSAATRARLEATVADARARGHYHRAVISRIAEAEAKGATDAQVVAASSRYEAQLRASHETMVRAGRPHPTEEETVAGASALARGYTSAQIEAAVRTGGDAHRSVVAAIESMMNTSVAAGASIDAAGSAGRNNAGTSAAAGVGAAVGSGAAAGAGVAGGVAAGAGSLAGSAAGSLGAGIRKP